MSQNMSEQFLAVDRQLKICTVNQLAFFSRSGRGYFSLLREFGLGGEEIKWGKKMQRAGLTFNVYSS